VIGRNKEKGREERSPPPEEEKESDQFKHEKGESRSPCGETVRSRPGQRRLLFVRDPLSLDNAKRQNVERVSIPLRKTEVSSASHGPGGRADSPSRSTMCGRSCRVSGSTAPGARSLVLGEQSARIQGVINSDRNATSVVVSRRASSSRNTAPQLSALLDIGRGRQRSGRRQDLTD